MLHQENQRTNNVTYCVKENVKINSVTLVKKICISQFGQNKSWKHMLRLVNEFSALQILSSKNQGSTNFFILCVNDST